MIFKEFNKIITLNNKDLEVCITVKVEEDECINEGDFDFGNEKDNKAYLKRFDPDRGDLFNASIVVTASALNLEGWDALGGCHIHCNNMFNSNPFSEDVELMVKEHGMVNNAISHLMNNIQEYIATLMPYNKIV